PRAGLRAAIRRGALAVPRDASGARRAVLRVVAFTNGARKTQASALSEGNAKRVGISTPAFRILRGALASLLRGYYRPRLPCRRPVAPSCPGICHSRLSPVQRRGALHLVGDCFRLLKDGPQTPKGRPAP